MPQSLAYATLAGVPAQYGLHTGFGALVAYAAFGSCRHLAEGPNAAICAASAAVITPLVGAQALGSETAAPYAAALALAAAAVYLGSRPPAHGLGLDVPVQGGDRRFRPRLLDGHHTPREEPPRIVIDQSHKLLGVPAPSDSGTLLIGALALVFVGYSESLVAARSMAVKHGYDIDPSQELIAQGMSCGTAGLVGGFSVDGSLSKTSVADSAGQESQMASLFNAVLVLMTLLFLASIFQNLPSATLGVWSKPHLRAHGCSSLRCDSDSPEPAHRVAELVDENEGCAIVSVIATAERAAMMVLTSASASRQPKNVSLPAGGPVLGCFVTRCPPASMAGTR